MTPDSVAPEGDSDAIHPQDSVSVGRRVAEAMTRWARLLLRLGLHRHKRWLTVFRPSGQVDAWCKCRYVWPVEMANRTDVI